MRTRRTLWVATVTSVMFVATAGLGVGAVAVNEQGVAALAQMVRDPLSAFAERSPGQRAPGALFQTKRSKMQAMVPPHETASPPIAASGLQPPFAQAANDRICERLQRPVPVVAPVGPEVARLADQLVAAVQQALAENPTGSQIQRENAVELAIENTLEKTGATPELARPALDVVQARLTALGLDCAPGVPQAMKVATVAAVDVVKPNDVQPGATSPPNTVPIGVPPFTGGGGGGGGVTHPAA